ncbi:Disulfide bond formation protein D [bacterium HR30]|nr:Disulfide bond formation protein D [bacterium HR30]
MERSAQRKRVLVVLGLSLLGVWLGYEAEMVHRQLRTDSAFTSFCNVNRVVNCDVVLSSRWSEIAGVSVSLLATLFYAALSLLAVSLLFVDAPATRRRITGALVAAVGGGVAFSAYMAVVAFWILRAVCVLCTGLYLVALANFFAVWRLHRSLRVASRAEQAISFRRDLWLYAGLAVAGLVVIASVLWETSRLWREPASAEEVAQSDPRFTEWFRNLTVVDIPVDSRNSRGPADARVTIVEFSDFECTHCASLHKALKETWLRSPGQVRIVFRHFPLDSTCNPLVQSRFHPLACEAALAAECAGSQGKFWQYHDWLFDHQKNLSSELLRQFARELGLDLVAFERCMQDPSTRQRVESDVAMGIKLGVNSTPTMFLNGRTIRGALDADTLHRALLLAQASGGVR